MKPANGTHNLLLALAAGAFTAPAYAQTRISVNIAPPAVHHEIVPAMAPGYVWAPGYWGWSGERHVWVRGRPILEREGHVWMPDRWEQRNSVYHRTAGHWERDNGYRPGKRRHGHEDMGRHLVRDRRED